MTTRSFATTAAALAALTLTTGGSTFASSSVPAARSAVPPAPASYVGVIDTPGGASRDPLIAVDFLHGSRVQAFVCDRRALWEWFSGPASATGLASRDGSGKATLVVHRAGRRLTGALRLAGGHTLRFTLHPPTGTDGLYLVRSVGPGGRFAGTSLSGGRLAGKVNGKAVVTETFTSPHGTVTVLHGRFAGFRLAEHARYGGFRQVLIGKLAAGRSRLPGTDGRHFLY